MATLQEQLEEANAAYQAIITGKQVRAVVDQNGERIEFTSANRQQLYLYIQSLNAQLGHTTPTRGPAGFLF